MHCIDDTDALDRGRESTANGLLHRDEHRSGEMHLRRMGELKWDSESKNSNARDG
jgi:hypothetical protein